MPDDETVPDLEDTIAENAAGPAEVRGDAASVRQHPLPDQIAAARFQAANAAVRSPGLGIVLRKIVPPSAGGS